MAKKAGTGTVKSKTTQPVSTPRRAPADSTKRRLPGFWQIIATTTRTISSEWQLFLGITLVYGLLNVLFAQGLSASNDVSSLKNSIDSVFGGSAGSIPTGLAIMVTLIGSAGNTTSQTAGAYQSFLAIIGSLAVIWTLRQVYSGKVPRVRDGFYRGMTPLVPFLLVLVVVAFQIIPFTIGSAIYSLVINNGIAVNLIEKLAWALVYLAFTGWTVYMLSSSLFAVYIVTLPELTPLKALRSAKDLVKGYRWSILRKLIALPIVLISVAAVIMLPIIIILTPIAQYVFFLLTMFTLVAIHSFMYTLYRELIND